MKEDKEEPIVEAVEEPRIEAVEEPRLDPVERPKDGAVVGPGSEGEEDAGIEDRLELDRMEVKPAAEPVADPVAEPEVEVEPEGVEPAEPEEKEPARPNLLAMLASHWIWIVAFLVGLSVVSALLLFLLTPGGGSGEQKLGKRVHAITASLGGEHYVRFNLYGPFRDSKGQAALERSMPKIKNDLILSGGNPKVASWIEEKDLYFLESHILDIVSKATGIPVDQLDLKGLSVTRYSDEAEIE